MTATDPDGAEVSDSDPSHHFGFEPGFGIIWQNGPETITIGSADAKSNFAIGTTAAAPAGILWTGATAIDNNDWSQGGNWQGGSPPTESDEAIFGAVDSGGINIVDQDFTIASLHYTGAGSHTTDLGDDPNTPGDQGNELTVTGDVTVGTANSDRNGSLSMRNIEVIAHVQALQIGLNTAGNGTASGNLMLQSGALLNASDTDALNVGRETGTSANLANATANGSLTFGTNSSITLGTEQAPAILNIGWSQNTSNFGSGSATGVLDALEEDADIDFHLSALNVGHGATRRGFGLGTLEWNQTEVIDATSIYFGRGNATGNLEVPEGGQFHLGSETDPISLLGIAFVDSGDGTATADIDFSITDPIFTAFIADELSVGRETGTSLNLANATANGSLTLGTNSSITLGTEQAPAILNIGWSQNTSNFGSGSATGILDASEQDADFNLNLSELNVGRGSILGSGNGTLKWDHTEVIAATNVYFGRGSATGILEVPENGEFHLGTEADPISFLGIAYNDAGNLTATADLDFSITDPIFTAFIADQRSVGQETGTTANLASARAEGNLTLGSNSTINLGLEDAPATLNIGWSQNVSRFGSGAAIGALDAIDGTLNADLSDLRIGQNSSRGSGMGEFIAGDGVNIDSTTANVGVGPGATGNLRIVDNFGGSFQADTLNFGGGAFDFGDNTLNIGQPGNISVQTFNWTGGLLTGNFLNPAADTFIMTGGTLAVEHVLANLDQQGGTLAPGTSPGVTTVEGDYGLASAGTLQIEIEGTGTPGDDYDQLDVNGTVNVNSDAGSGGQGRTLSVVCDNYAAAVSDTFLILDNDENDLLIGLFRDESGNQLTNNAEFEVVCSEDIVTFQISYAGGDGNDVELTVTDVSPAPIMAAAFEVAELEMLVDEYEYKDALLI